MRKTFLKIVPLLIAPMLCCIAQAQTNYLFVGDRNDGPARGGSIHRYRIDGENLIPAPSDGQTGAYWDKSEGQPHKGRRVTQVLIAPDGDIYATSRDTGSVLRFDGKTGAFKNVVINGLDAPDAMVLGPDGNLYIASKHNVARCTLDGKPLPGFEQIGVLFAGGGGLRDATGLAFGPDGNLYVASQTTSQILRFDGRTGAFRNVFVGGGISAPSQIMFGPDKNLYVASTAGPGFNPESGYVAKFDGRTGKPLGTFAPDAKGALGIAFAPNGDLLVTDYWSAKIKRFDAKTGAQKGQILDSPTNAIFYYLTAARRDDATGKLSPVQYIKPPLAVAPQKPPALNQGANIVKDWKNALAPQGVPGPELTLAANKKANYVLLLPQSPTTMDEKSAAILASWLEEMTAAPFAVKREGEALPANQKLISVGRTALLANSGLPEATLDLGDEGYAIAAKGDTLFLVGGRVRGAIYAAYTLLEEDLGCRWYTANAIPRIPRHTTLKFRPTLRHLVPKLLIRDPYYFEAFDGDWALKNKTQSTNAPIDAKWGGYAKTPPGYFTHSFNVMVPPDKYFATHPEYFAELGGKRNPAQLDLSNPEVLKLAVEAVKKALRENPDSKLVSVSPNDGRGYCECSICLALDNAEATVKGSKSGSLLNFVNKVAEAIEPEFPNVKVSTLAYLDTFMPPKTIRPRKNVAIQLCTDSHAWKYQFCRIPESNDFQTAMKAWHAIGAEMHIWDYTADYVHYPVPMPNMPIVTDNMKFFLDHGATGIMLQGTYQTTGGDRAAMRSWVWSKQMWNPELDTRALMRDFIFGYYGDAAQPIWDYNMMLWQMWETEHAKPHPHDGTRPNPNPLLINDSPCSAPPDWSLLSPEYLQKTSTYFAQAEKLAKDPETLQRVQTAKHSLLYVKLGQALGYVSEFGDMIPGSWVKSGDENLRATYKALLEEYKKISAASGVTYISERTPNSKIIEQWEAILQLNITPLPTAALSPTWKFKTDAQQIGVQENWAATQTADADWKPLIGRDGTGWEQQGFEDYRGYAWYRQSFALPANFERRKHLYLYFGAVDSESEIYVNGEKVFEHTLKSTGLTPETIWNDSFAVDVAPHWKDGQENLVAVRVTSAGGVRGILKPTLLISSDKPLTIADLKLAVMRAE